MSLIADALKTAQRERQKRATAAIGMSSSAPLLVPLRPRNDARFSWSRALGLGVAGAVVLGVAILAIQIRDSARRPALPSVPLPPTADLIAAPHASRPAATGARQPEPSQASAAGTGARPAAPIDGFARTEGQSVPVASPRVRGATSTRSHMPSGATVIPQSASASTNGLRIAIDQPRQAEAAGLFEEAVRAHRANDLPTARPLYERLLLVTPDDPDLLNNLGVLLSAQREYERATAFLRRAVALAPGNAGAWTNLGFTLRAQGRTGDAIAAFQRALLLDPKRLGARISLAQQYITIGSLPQARELIDQLIVDEPASAEAQYTRGQLLELQGDPAGAVRAYEEFLRLASPSLASYSERVRRHLDTLAAKTGAR